MATQNVRVYEIATATGANLQNNEICHETSANATTGFKMFASKNNDGTVLRMLALDQNAQVADLTVTGDITTLTGSITTDALSLSTLSANRILYGDFGQASTFKWQNSKLRIGSTVAPTYAIDVSVASADGLRIEQTGSGANNPLIVYEKTSSSPADNDGIGKTIFRGFDGDQSAPAKRDFVTIEALSTDVSAITGEYKISTMYEGNPNTFVFGGGELTGAEKFNVWPTGHLQNKDGFRTVAPHYGPAILSFPYGDDQPQHTGGVGSFDYAGGASGEKQFTKTNTNFNFTQADADTGNWILLTGKNLGTFLEIKTFINNNVVLVDGFGLDADLASQGFVIYKHPTFVTGDGNKTEFSVGADGEFEIYSYNFTNGKVVEIKLNSASDNQFGLKIEANANGQNVITGQNIVYTTGALGAGEVGGGLFIEVDETGASAADSTTITAGIAISTTTANSGTKKGITVLPGHDIAYEVFGSPAIDPGFGYEVSSGSVVDRVNSGGGGDDAFKNASVDHEIFDADNDYILIGSAAKFEDIEVVLATGSSKDCDLEFYYSKAGDNWTALPIQGDGTNGFQSSGNIIFAAPADWTKDDEAEADGDITDAYYVKIVRTYSTVIPVLPTESFFKTFASISQGMKIRGDGTILPASLADASADNSSIYYSTTQSKLVFKDGAGAIQDLY